MRSSETSSPFRLSDQPPEIRAMAVQYAKRAVEAAIDQGFSKKVSDISVLAEIGDVLQPAVAN